jgi:hypothetical protein
MAEDRGVLYESFEGVDNLNAGIRAKSRHGVFLKSASNVFITRKRSIRTREGYELISSGDYHSIFHRDNVIYGVKDLNLIARRIDQSQETIIRPAVGINDFHFAAAGQRIFGTNNDIIGYIESFTWSAFPAVSQTYKRPMPPGHLIEHCLGRLFVARENIIIASDPAAYHFYDERQDRNLIMRPSRVTMMRGLDDGLWHSDSNQIMFESGKSFNEFERKVVAPYPAIEGTASFIRENVMVDRTLLPQAFFFSTPEGICVAGTGGQFFNLTDQGYKMPSAIKGVGFLRTGEVNQYITILT